MTKKYKLSNGVEIPNIGFGTWMISNENAKEVVKNAIAVGYRHIDTAEAYGNEEGVGLGIKESKIAREEIFVTTKIDANEKTYDGAKRLLEESLRKLDIGYIDLVIIHAPEPWNKFREDVDYNKENLEVWKVLEEAYSDGKVRAIGVSNFEIDDLQNIIDNAKIKPMVNQILTHISNTPLKLIKYCEENNILVEAYSPIAHGAVLNNEEIKAIASKYNVTVAQLCMRYCLQLGLLPLPKSENIEHMKNNLDVDFKISDEDMEILKNVKTITNYGEASNMPVFGGSIDEKGNFVSGNFKERK